MRKLLYLLATVTGVGLVIAALQRSNINDIYEDSRRHRVRQLNQQGMLPHEIEY